MPEQVDQIPEQDLASDVLGSEEVKLSRMGEELVLRLRVADEKEDSIPERGAMVWVSIVVGG